MNDSKINEIYQNSPLLAFSFHTHGQAIYLTDLGAKLISEMQQLDDEISNFNDVY